MARELFRVTVDEPNYSNVLGEPLDEGQLEHLPSPVDGSRERRIWAINVDSPAANTYRNYMGPEDGLLFYKVSRGLAWDEKRYVGVGTIGDQFEIDPEEAQALFRTSNAQLLFTVEDFPEISKRIEDVEPILGYKQHPQRTQRVKPDRYRSVDSALERLRQ